MGMFNLLKKKREKATNRLSVDLEHLTVDGDLPWGWIYTNKEFTEKIQKEYSYFLQLWNDSRYKSPKELYSALKSFVSYLEDVEKICKAKGECFEFWFYQILTGTDYLLTRQKELQELESNLLNLQKDYEHKQNKFIELQPKVIEKLIENDNILQSNFWKMFDESDKNIVREITHTLKKEGKIEETKSGRSYLLHYKR